MLYISKKAQSASKYTREYAWVAQFKLKVKTQEDPTQKPQLVPTTKR